MKHKYIIIIILISNLFIGCITNNGNSGTNNGNSGIDGIVLIGPNCPVFKEGESCPDKPFAATIEIQKDGLLLVTIRSGNDGKFNVNLTPGEYKLIPLDGMGPQHAEPQFVKIEYGKFTNATINYDSGIR